MLTVNKPELYKPQLGLCGRKEFKLKEHPKRSIQTFHISKKILHYYFLTP